MGAANALQRTTKGGNDPPWGTALTVGKTLIYRQTLTFP